MFSRLMLLNSDTLNQAAAWKKIHSVKASRKLAMHRPLVSSANSNLQECVPFVLIDPLGAPLV